MFKFKRIMSMLLVLLVIQVMNVSVLHVFAESVVDDVYTVQNDTAQELELPPLPSPTPSPADTIVYGDVNGDGMFNSIDFAYMRQYLLGMITDFPGNRGMEAADVDGSQGVNSIDFAYMRQYLLGIIDEFPVSYVNTPTPTMTLTPKSTPTVTPTPTLTVTPTPTPSSTPDFSQLRPSNIDVSLTGLDGVYISWDPVEGAGYYEIFRDGVSIGTTSSVDYTDSNIMEGIDYTYYIIAANEEGVSSQHSEKVIVNIGDVTIRSDTILNDNRFYGSLNLEGGALLNLNGYKLSVFSVYNQPFGETNVNGGRLEVKGHYCIGLNGILRMTNHSDYVYVEMDFIMDSSYDHREYLTAGIMEIEGNLTQKNSYDGPGEGRSFIATGTHKVILSGNSVQFVSTKYSEYGLIFNELEIRNKSGVQFDSPISLGTLKGNYKVLGTLTINYIDSPISGDVTIDGDLVLMGGLFDLAGHRFVVNGNLTQSAVLAKNKINVNGGRLEVYGDYSLVSIVTEDGFSYMQTCSELQMTSEADYVYVGGNFTTDSMSDHVDCLTAGTMEVKGHFTQMNSGREFGGHMNFWASGTHKVVLSGSTEQVVVSQYYGLRFNQLEIQNEVGVRFDSPIALGTLKGKYKVLGTMWVEHLDSPITGDVTIDGEFVFMGGVLDLAGHRFTVTGNLTQSGYYDVDNRIKINQGELYVQGDYSIITDDADTSDAILQMTDDADYVYVGGNFTTNSTFDHRPYLRAGTMEIKGNFTQMSTSDNWGNGPLNFNPSGTHRVILSGDSVQTITFEDPILSSFNILEITKPIETGYTFNATPVWKTLEENFTNYVE